jgi:stage II sporulation protein AA (anti-sigma F factor antagonist)
MLTPNYRHLKYELQQGVLVLAPLDAELRTEEVVGRLRDEMFAALAEARASKVVLDLRHVQYVSSAGFQPLILLRRRLLDAGGAMVLCGLSPVLAEVFRVTRLVATTSSPGQFESATDAAAAVALLAQKG